MNAAARKRHREERASAGGGEKDSAATRVAVDALDLVLFLIIATVLCARPLIPETMERVAFSFLPVEAGSGPDPGTSVVLDFILLAAAVIVCVRHSASIPRRRVWIAGYVLLLIAVVVSVSAANDKRAAANAGSELFAIALAGAALAKLARERWMVRILLAGIIAVGVANAIKCVTQYEWEFADTLDDWQARKPQLVAEGRDPNSPTIVNFERRMQSTESFGYLSHPNVAGSCMAMSLMCAGGVLLALLLARGADASRRYAAALAAAALAAVLCAGIWLTSSLGAEGSAVAGIALLLAVGWLGMRRAWNTRAAFLALLCVYVGVIAVGVGYGLAKGALPGASLAFRWEYWQAAVRGYRDAPLTGVGGDNFRSVYLLYKSPASAEELSNPHDLWLSMLVELGPAGLLAALLLIGALTYAAVAACRPGDRLPGQAERNRGSPAPSLRRCGAIVAFVACVPLVEAAATGLPFGASADVFPAMLLLWLVMFVCVWAAAATLCYSLVSQADESDATARWLPAALLAAIAAALIHNLIGFSLTTAAGLSIFAVIAACVISLNRSAQQMDSALSSESSRISTIMAALAGVVIAAAHLLLVVTPVVRSDAVAERLVKIVPSWTNSTSLSAAADFERELSSADHWDPVSLTSFGQAVLSRARSPEISADLRTGWLDLAEDAILEAIRRAPRGFAARQLQAEITDERAAASNDVELLKTAAEQWDAAVKLYPTDPRARIGAGLAWARLWDRTRSESDAEHARAHLKAALAIDATRSAGNASKLRKREMQIVEDTLKTLGTN